MHARSPPSAARSASPNCFDAACLSFEKRVLPELTRRGVAPLGMKSLGGDAPPVLHGVVTAEEAIRYAMSLPVAVTVTGIDSPEVLRQNLAIAPGFKAMTPEEMDGLRTRCAPAAGDGHLEMYKSTMKYDADECRRQHGYTAAEAVGRPITFIIPPERLDEERGIIDRLRRGERVEHFETVRAAKDGRRLDISLTVSPIRDAEGHAEAVEVQPQATSETQAPRSM